MCSCAHLQDLRQSMHFIATQVYIGLQKIFHFTWVVSDDVFLWKDAFQEVTAHLRRSGSRRLGLLGKRLGSILSPGISRKVFSSRLWSIHLPGVDTQSFIADGFCLFRSRVASGTLVRGRLVGAVVLSARSFDNRESANT